MTLESKHAACAGPRGYAAAAGAGCVVQILWLLMSRSYVHVHAGCQRLSRTIDEKLLPSCAAGDDPDPSQGEMSLVH